MDADSRERVSPPKVPLETGSHDYVVVVVQRELISRAWDSRLSGKIQGILWSSGSAPLTRELPAHRNREFFELNRDRICQNRGEARLEFTAGNGGPRSGCASA